MTKYIPEILNEINNDLSLIAKYKGNTALRLIFEYAFIPEKKFLLPDTDPPYKEDPAPIGMSPTTFVQEIRRFYIFTKQKELPVARREALFIQLLESTHPSEAKLLLAIKDQNLGKLYSNITVNFLIDNGFLPEELRQKDEKVKKDGATSRKKSQNSTTKEPTGI